MRIIPLPKVPYSRENALHMFEPSGIILGYLCAEFALLLYLRSLQEAQHACVT